MSDVVTDVPDAPHPPMPAPSIVDPPVVPRAGFASLRRWFGGAR